MSKKYSLIKNLFLGFVILFGLAYTRTSEGSVLNLSQKRGWKVNGTTAQGASFELIGVEDGRPVYYITNNAVATTLTGADILQGPPRSIEANDVTVGIWDAGWVRFTHQEFQESYGSRVMIKDSITAPDSDTPFGDHATHIAGTIGAQGIDPNAKGMAPTVNMDSYEWLSDIPELVGRAATASDEADKIYLSNHPYGIIAGWETGKFRTIRGDFNSDDIVNFLDWTIFANAWLTIPTSPNWNSKCDIAPLPDGDEIIDGLDLSVVVEHWLEINVEAPYWFGTWGELEDRNFGSYGSFAGTWDSVFYSAPYCLGFKSAGNDGDDDSPVNETPFWYLDANEPSALVDPNGGRWVQKIYDDVNDLNAPYGDGWDNGGYDTIPVISTSKNIMTVGAVDDTGDMVGFSGWGPTDDGRIKPDIVANGFELYSPIGVNDVTYASYSGTSQASASAAGSSALLVQYYDDLFGGAMRASTLKALIIHTATDLGNAGPDYKYGWGLMDANEAADYIVEDFNDPNSEKIIEEVLAQGTSNIYTFTLQDDSPFRATLCWTDPSGNPISVLDNNTPCLINDLDLRIIDNNDPNNSYEPYILDPNNPTADANNGDNIVDNVEQVYISTLTAGTYTAKISHKGTLTNGSQHYSLILSEPRPIHYIFVDDDSLNDPGHGDPTVSDPLEDGSSEHPFDSIQKAIDNSNNGDSIIVRDGTYTGVGNYDIDTDGKAITISREEGPFVSTVDCELTGRAFLFQSGETTTTVVDGLTLINGYAEDPLWPQEPNETDTPDGYGGAIYCKNSSPMIKNCIITDNLADYSGGGIFCHENANAVISNCDISYNDCGSNIYYILDPCSYDVKQLGGGIYCNDASPTILNCMISYNYADGAGGGIACKDSDAVIMNCNINNNECWADNDYVYQHGGGIYCKIGRQIIQGCTIEGNNAAWSGGGIAVLGKNEVWDTNNVLDLNDVWDSNNSTMIQSCKIKDNDSWASGGGIFGSSDDSVLTITNCLISNNWGYWSGGISSCNGSLERIENCTVVNNVASWKYTNNLIGGLECYYAGARINDSIFWDNSGVQIEGIRDVNDPNIITKLGVTYSDIQIKDANGVTDPNQIWPGEGNINEDPLFAGPTHSDYHLQTEYPNGRWNPETGMFDIDDLVTSPCINAGDPSSDYLFEPTPNGGRINMGVYGNTVQASKSDD